MSNLNSLTLITKDELDLAMSNFLRIKEEHQKLYDAALKEHRAKYKHPWYRRKKTIRKMEKMSDERFFRNTVDTGWCSVVELLVVFKELPELAHETLGYKSSKWTDIAITLHASEKDEHLVSDGVLGWVVWWKGDVE